MLMLNNNNKNLKHNYKINIQKKFKNIMERQLKLVLLQPLIIKVLYIGYIIKIQ